MIIEKIPHRQNSSKSNQNIIKTKSKIEASKTYMHHHSLQWFWWRGQTFIMGPY